jgi:hypothetical protein
LFSPFSIRSFNLDPHSTNAGAMPNKPDFLMLN